MASAASDIRKGLKRAKLHIERNKLNFARTKVTSGVDACENKVSSLLAAGRKNRNLKPSGPSAQANNGGANNFSRLKFLKEGPIAEVVSFLDPVQTRAPLEQWIRTLIPKDATDDITDIISGVSEDGKKLIKIDIEVGQRLELTFSKLPSYNDEPCPKLLQEYMRIVVGLMEKFYQNQDKTITLRGQKIQLVVSCQLIKSSDKDSQPPFKVTGNREDTVVVTSHYVVSLEENSTLRLGFSDLEDGKNKKPDVYRDAMQDTLTLWRDDLLAHRVKATGTALLLSISLVDPQQVFTS